MAVEPALGWPSPRRTSSPSIDPLLAEVRAPRLAVQSTPTSDTDRRSTQRPSGPTKLGLRPRHPHPRRRLSTRIGTLSAPASELGDVVNVIGTSTCIIGMSDQPSNWFPAFAAWSPAPSTRNTRSASKPASPPSGDIFEAIGQAAPATTVQQLSVGLRPPTIEAGQTGILRLTWDNGDRTVLVNPRTRRGHPRLEPPATPAQDELFAAIEGTALPHPRHPGTYGSGTARPCAASSTAAASPNATPRSTRSTATPSTSRCWCWTAT